MLLGCLQYLQPQAKQQLQVVQAVTVGPRHQSLDLLQLVLVAVVVVLVGMAVTVVLEDLEVVVEVHLV
jgi:preprotein translocase subunit SecF